VWGWTGNDELHGEGGNDFLGGDGGNDTIYGGTGSDTIYGWTGDDVLHGNEGEDIISGEEGNDSIIGGAGHDELTGGEGKDIFIFYAVDDSNPTINSRDTIMDFEVGKDKMQFSAETGVIDFSSFTIKFDTTHNRTNIDAKTTDFMVSLIGDFTEIITASDMLFMA
jgi:Ca2+-binding RTX toxin-like protein